MVRNSTVSVFLLALLLSLVGQQVCGQMGASGLTVQPQPAKSKATKGKGTELPKPTPTTSMEAESNAPIKVVVFANVDDKAANVALSNIQAFPGITAEDPNGQVRVLTGTPDALRRLKAAYPELLVMTPDQATGLVKFMDANAGFFHKLQEHTTQAKN